MFNAPVFVNVVPAGTPVVAAFGKSVGGVGVAVGDTVAVGVGVGVGVGAVSTRSNHLVCDTVRLRLSVTFSVTCRSDA
jgi:hypothetical protein